ncbi:hypothetical protein AV530_009843 [Patagioenas fasciata monilis]|uniref:Uncharacterized protein n=1 Tax=Patagioenas fasciata monilis TaxID=372326 RepID=A0A1V4KA63_PATFA|nr:hypothetical protein AV530_009843 [Patagioenas fasciata monilis]
MCLMKNDSVKGSRHSVPLVLLAQVSTLPLYEHLQGRDEYREVLQGGIQDHSESAWLHAQTSSSWLEVDKALNCAIHTQKRWSGAGSPVEPRICLTVVDLASVWQEGSPRHGLPWVGCGAEENKEAVVKAGSDGAKVSLKGFREEVVLQEKLACGNEALEAERAIGEGVKKATE